MRKSQFSQEQIVMALRQAESGTPVVEICRKLGVSEATFYRWKKRYGSLGVSELRELRQLREENRKGRSLHVSEIPFIQQDRESDRKSAAAADKRSRLASVISAAKGHGFL